MKRAVGPFEPAEPQLTAVGSEVLPADEKTALRQAAAGVESISVGSLLLSFLKIGSIGFGGGMAVIALMDQEVVQKHRYLPLDEFVNGVALGQILGAFAVNTAVFIGYRLFGLTGALLSAGAFLAPSVALVTLLSALYFRFHTVPALQTTVAGISPVVIALILSATWSIGRRVLHSWPTIAIAVVALLLGLVQVNAVWILVAAGLAGLVLPLGTDGAEKQPPSLGSTSKRGTVKSVAFALPMATPLSSIFGTFFKMGVVFFGGGFVLVPVLHSRLVTQLGWLKAGEFLDGLAISNLTPGPVALLATFAGYRLAGPWGALVATVALFAPGILLMLAISQQYDRFRNDQRAKRFLAGVNPAVAGLILSAAFLLGRTAMSSWHGYALLGLSFGLLVALRWHPVLVLAIGAAAGYFRLLR